MDRTEKMVEAMQKITEDDIFKPYSKKEAGQLGWMDPEKRKLRILVCPTTNGTSVPNRLNITIYGMHDDEYKPERGEYLIQGKLSDLRAFLESDKPRRLLHGTISEDPKKKLTVQVVSVLDRDNADADIMRVVEVWAKAHNIRVLL